MALTVGQSLSYYEILGPLGAGGMGEVYRARDTRLERDVAIKVLPDELAEDDDRLRRFEREAKTLASLSHPNVAHVYGIDQVGDTCFIAMELVPGEDLAARLARGRLPVDEALDVCLKIADGLEAAHEAGVVHRDLKPANVRVTPDGNVKLLDFGLAKPVGPLAAGGGSRAVQSDSVVVTEEGLVLGTPTYMSPEQARGRAVDRRTDIWAFGCVLYECLTGERAFAGANLADVLSAVLTSEPSLDALPAATPRGVRRLLERTLARDPRARLRDVGEARIVLENVRAGRDDEPAGEPAAARRRSVFPWVLASAVVAATLGFVAGRRGGPDPPTAEPIRQLRFTIRHPEPTASIRNPIVAPDGSYVAYLASLGADTRLWVRELGERDARVLPGTESAEVPFVSPDGRYLGFFAGGWLMKVAVSGGMPVGVCEATGSPGAAWSEDDWIVFSPSWTTGLVRVRPNGDSLEQLTTVDAEAGETGHWWPKPIRGGGAILYTAFSRAGTLNKARIMSFDVATGRATFVCDGAYPVALSSGHLLFQRAGVYEVAPFDPVRAELTGPPVTVLEDVPPLHAGGSHVRFFSVSRSGVVAYLSRANDAYGPKGWFRMDRTAALERIELDPSAVADPALSPDDRLLAYVGLVAGETDIFVRDVALGIDRRLTTESVNEDPVWSSDGDRLLFESVRLGTYDIFEADTSGTSETRPLYTRDIDVFGGGFLPGGERILVELPSPNTGRDLYLVDVASGAREPFVATPGTEEESRVSFDGRFVAYVSDVSGRKQAYVAALSGGAPPIQVSRVAGDTPRWTGGGSRLVFFDGDTLFVAEITFDDGRVAVASREPFVHGDLPEELTNRLSREFTPSRDAAYVVIGVYDQPLRPELEVVVDGLGALGLR